MGVLPENLGGSVRPRLSTSCSRFPKKLLKSCLNRVKSCCFYKSCSNVAAKESCCSFPLFALMQKYDKSKISKHFVQFCGITSVTKYLFLSLNQKLRQIRPLINININLVIHLRHSSPSPAILNFKNNR